MKVNQLKAGALLSYVSMGLGFLISIIYTPIMLRLLGQSEYGLYNLVSSVVSYLGLLSFGFGSAYMRYYSRYKVKEDEVNIARLNGMFLTVFIAIGFISLFAGIVLVLKAQVILGDKITQNEMLTAKILMAIMVLNISISLACNIFYSYITANERYVFQKMLQLIKIVVGPFVMLPVLLMGYKSIGMVVVTTIITILVELLNIYFCFKQLKMKFVFTRFDYRLMKEIAIFSSYIFMNMIIDQVNWSVDKFILGRYKGTQSVAIYGIAAQLNSYYLSLSTAISGVFIPRVNTIVADSNDNEKLTLLFTKIGRIQLMLLSLVASGLVFFGEPFIIKWAGNDYREAYPILLLLVIPVTVPLIQNLGIEIQRAKNMHQFRSWIYLLIAIGNIFLSIPLVKTYGGTGAALGTGIALIIGNGFIMNWYYHARVGLNMHYFWKKIFELVKGLIIPLFTGVIIYLYVDLYNIITFVVCGSIYVITFCISIYFFGMDEYEKNLITTSFFKVLKKKQL